MQEKHRYYAKITILLLPLIIFLLSLSIGRYHIPVSHTIGILLSKLFSLKAYWSGQEETIIMHLRLPRALLALLIGAGLSMSGTVFQGIFKNPLVSPSLLGVASGAGFGGALAMVFFPQKIIIILASFVFGLLAVFLAFLLSKTHDQQGMLSLVLSGIIISAFFTALISLIKYLADPTDTLPGIVYWLMGSLTSSSVSTVLIVSIPLLSCMFVIYLLRWRVNLLSMGDDEAISLGERVTHLRYFFIILCTFIVAITVSVAGVIGWVGLVIPHIARLLVGADHRALVPFSASLGAAYLLTMDTLTRTVSPAEIPLGLLTALIGAVCFAIILSTHKEAGWNDT
ncbi:iron ABC transporter permease [Candidatus Woesearchaeota archaeon]|nr:iron ABC transporter permease [Candidatus Woesearchaeota archaeon]HIH37715.1 iron ABC transporter permease [Candidatus Woesearchaeota archaeon]HIJ03268.1 iron ABC transporter permease [Candidatus Woesearchaeota archaeon]